MLPKGDLPKPPVPKKDNGRFGEQLRGRPTNHEGNLFVQFNNSQSGNIAGSSGDKQTERIGTSDTLTTRQNTGGRDLYTHFGNNTPLRNTENMPQNTLPSPPISDEFRPLPPPKDSKPDGFGNIQKEITNVYHRVEIPQNALPSPPISNELPPLPPTKDSKLGGFGGPSGGRQKLTDVYHQAEKNVNLSEKKLPAVPKDSSGDSSKGQTQEFNINRSIIENTFAPFKDKLTTFDEKASQSEFQSFLADLTSSYSDKIQSSSSEVQQPSPNQEIPSERAEQLRQQAWEGLGKQKENQNKLDIAKTTFDRNAHVQKVERLTNWNINNHKQSRQMDWIVNHSGQPTQRNPENIYTKTIAAKWTKFYVQDHLKDLREMQNTLKGEMRKIPRIHSTIENHYGLQAEVENMDNHGTKRRIEQFIETHNETLGKNYEKWANVTKQAESQLEGIDTSIENRENELLGSTLELWQLEGQNLAHPFFPEAEMRDIQIKNEVLNEFLQEEMPDAQIKNEVLKEELARGRTVDIFRTLFKARDIRVADEKFITQTLGGHPLGGELDREQLRTELPKHGLQLQEMELKELKMALDKGEPIGAIFNNARLEHVPENLQHEGPVILVPLDSQEKVVVIDEWRENAYEVSFDTLEKVWTGEAIVPSSTSQEIQQTRRQEKQQAEQTSKLDGLQKQLAEGLAKQQTNRPIYLAAQETFKNRTQEIDRLAVWNAPDLTVNRVMEWANPGASQINTEGTDSQTSAAEGSKTSFKKRLFGPTKADKRAEAERVEADKRAKVERTKKYLDNYLERLGQMQNDIRGELDKLPTIHAIEEQNHKDIQSELKKPGYIVETDHVQKSLKQYDLAYNQNLQNFIIPLHQEAQSQRGKIDEIMRNIQKIQGEINGMT